MPTGSENESEILLGNKQLLAIFFVIAILLGIAFTGGYMVGRGSPEKKPLLIAATNDTAAAQSKDSGLETHPVGPPNDATVDDSNGEPRPDSRATRKSGTVGESPDGSNHPTAPLGSPKEKIGAKVVRQPAEPMPVSSVGEGYAPQTGQTFLQVAALSRDDAYGVADVLTKKGFRAHSVPKPGNPKLYRVLVGPIRDTSDLSATRDKLRKIAGFQDVILQHY